MQRVPAAVLDRDGLEVDFEDTFADPILDETRWLPHYLPHWSTPDRTVARYEIGDGRLRLLIRADHPPWCPALDGDVRASSLQTGVFAGPVGSSVGQHQFHPNVVVRTAQQNRTLYTTRYGLVEMRARVPDDRRVMVALWMIGFEDEPKRSSEICVAEIFGRDVRPDRARVGMGVHPFGDPSIVDDFRAEELPIDVRQWHTYSADWTPEGVAWYVDDRLVRVVDQSATYPMQLMLGIYEFPVDEDARRPEDYPKAFEVAWIRVSRSKSD